MRSLGVRQNGLVRLFGLALAFCLVGCTTTVVSVTVGVDGSLDCEAGEVPRSVHGEWSFPTERRVAEASLESFLGAGRLLRQVEPGLWSVVSSSDDREIASSVVEQNGDGLFTAGHEVLSCFQVGDGPAAIDGELDCADDYRWGMQPGLDPDAELADSAEAALSDFWERMTTRYGGEVVMVDEFNFSLVLFDREQVVARAGEVTPGGWALSSAEGCRGFEVP